MLGQCIKQQAKRSMNSKAITPVRPIISDPDLDLNVLLS